MKKKKKLQTSNRPIDKKKVDAARRSFEKKKDNFINTSNLEFIDTGSSGSYQETANTLNKSNDPLIVDNVSPQEKNQRSGNLEIKYKRMEEENAKLKRQI